MVVKRIQPQAPMTGGSMAQPKPVASPQIGGSMAPLPKRPGILDKTNPFSKQAVRAQATPAMGFKDWRAAQDFSAQKANIQGLKQDVWNVDQRGASGADGRYSPEALAQAEQALRQAQKGFRKEQRQGFEKYQAGIPQYDAAREAKWDARQAEAQQRYDKRMMPFERQAGQQAQEAADAQAQFNADVDVNTGRINTPDMNTGRIKPNTDAQSPFALKNTTRVNENEMNLDFSAERDRVQDALMARLNQQLDRDRSAQEAQLLNQGIGMGSRAYGSAQDDMNRAATDARLGAILSAGQEQSRLWNDALSQGQFNLGVQQQAYNQRMGREQADLARTGQRFNQRVTGRQDQRAAQGQDFSQRLAGRQDRRQAQGQKFNQAQSTFQNNLAARQQALNEQFALRNQPINEITALLSGSQVQSPNFNVNTPGAIPTTDVAGITQQGYGNQFAAWQQQQQQRNNILGGLLGAGAGIFSGAGAAGGFGSLF